MGVRIGVDVGGTFTKAVGIDLASGERRVAGRRAHHPRPPRRVGRRRRAGGAARWPTRSAPANVELITYSTTQAVNALLEGDVAIVGVLGLGRQPDLRKAAKRTRLDKVELSPGRRLPTVNEFLDVTEGSTTARCDAALDRLQAAGATTICVAEAFAPDGGGDERRAVQAALDRGLPACGSAEMTGLYGLELRAVTAALNASILPIAVRTEQHVERGVAAAGIDGAGDGDAGRRRRHRPRGAAPRTGPRPLLGPGGLGGRGAASHADRRGHRDRGRRHLHQRRRHQERPARPLLRAGREPRHRGASARRAGHRRGRRLDAAGPEGPSLRRRSSQRPHRRAALLLLPDRGRRSTGAAPRSSPLGPRTHADYVVLRLADGGAAAITNTCAAVALGIVEPGRPRGDRRRPGGGPPGLRRRRRAAAARRRRSGPAHARRVGGSGRARWRSPSPRSTASSRRPSSRSAEAPAGSVASSPRRLGLECHVPPLAEVISAVGDALSLVRVERERSITGATTVNSDALAREAEEACLAAGRRPVVDRRAGGARRRPHDAPGRGHRHGRR